MVQLPHLFRMKWGLLFTYNRQSRMDVKNCDSSFLSWKRCLKKETFLLSQLNFLIACFLAFSFNRHICSHSPVIYFWLCRVAINSSILIIFFYRVDRQVVVNSSFHHSVDLFYSILCHFHFLGIFNNELIWHYSQPTDLFWLVIQKCSFQANNQFTYLLVRRVFRWAQKSEDLVM